MISNKFKVIFIHIPKCAGCSIEKAFNEKLMNHETAENIYEKAPNLWNKYYKFTIVRNTWDRFVSMYHFRKKNKIFSKWDYFFKEKSNISFKEWLMIILEKSKIQSQLDFFLLMEKTL